MGDRGQIFIEDIGVYLYTHYNAAGMHEWLIEALKRGKARWDDPEYLARIIFCDMSRDDSNGLLGLGIGNTRHEDVWRVLRVNCNKQKIYDERYHWEQGTTLAKESTFEEFIAT